MRRGVTSVGPSQLEVPSLGADMYLGDRQVRFVPIPPSHRRSRSLYRQSQGKEAPVNILDLFFLRCISQSFS